MNEFRFTLPYTVRVADINYGGHASNAAVLNFFQDARIAYLANLGPHSELDIGGCGLILSEAHVRYLGEMFLGDHVQIGVRIGEMGRAGFVMEYRVERQGKTTAEGTTRLAAFDYQGRKPTRLPKAFRCAVAEFEGDEGPSRDQRPAESRAE